MTKQELEVLKNVYEKESGILELREKYEEYKKLDTPRNFERMKNECVLDDYLKFMLDAEKVLCDAPCVQEVNTLSNELELPKPSKALEEFKNKFNKFF